MTETVDVTVGNHGTIFLFEPHTEAANAWLDANVGDDAMWMSGALVVEHGYARDLADAMLAEGLVLQ